MPQPCSVPIETSHLISIEQWKGLGPAGSEEKLSAVCWEGRLMKLLHSLQKCNVFCFPCSEEHLIKPPQSLVRLTAVDSVAGGGKREAFIPNESFLHFFFYFFFCQQTFDASSHEGNISSELWVHFPPLSWNLPSLNTESRARPVDSRLLPVCSAEDTSS